MKKQIKIGEKIIMSKEEIIKEIERYWTVSPEKDEYNDLKSYVESGCFEVEAFNDMKNDIGYGSIEEFRDICNYIEDMINRFCQ